MAASRRLVATGAPPSRTLYYGDQTEVNGWALNEKEARMGGDSAATTHDAEALIRRLMLARNAPAVREAARRHGLDKAQLAELARRILEGQQKAGTEDRMGARYDIQLGEYLTLEQWVDRLLKK